MQLGITTTWNYMQDNAIRWSGSSYGLFIELFEKVVDSRLRFNDLERVRDILLLQWNLGDLEWC